MIFKMKSYKIKVIKC